MMARTFVYIRHRERRIRSKETYHCCRSNAMGLSFEIVFREVNFGSGDSAGVECRNSLFVGAADPWPFTIQEAWISS